MRTTVDLNDDVLRRAKRRAADEGIPLREVIETALRIQRSEVIVTADMDITDIDLRYVPTAGKFHQFDDSTLPPGHEYYLDCLYAFRLQRQFPTRSVWYEGRSSHPYE